MRWPGKSALTNRKAVYELIPTIKIKVNTKIFKRRKIG
jgi:hypothetical protein